MWVIKDSLKAIGCFATGLLIIALIYLFFNVTIGGLYLIFKAMPKEQLEVIDKCSKFIGTCIIIAVPVTLGSLYAKWRNRRKEIIRRADENNTFITARLVQKRNTEYRSDYENNNNDGRVYNYEGIYEYTINGETKSKRILFVGLPDDEIRLYLKNKNGSKVFSNTEYENKKWFVIPLIALATIVTLIWVVGMMSMISSLI